MKAKEEEDEEEEEVEKIHLKCSQKPKHFSLETKKPWNCFNKNSREASKEIKINAEWKGKKYDMKQTII